MKGTKLAHVAPPATNVPFLMKGLFEYLKKQEELMLIKSCVFHYEMEFIHPFSDGRRQKLKLLLKTLLAYRTAQPLYIGTHVVCSPFVLVI